eukprot:TRINITY_DN12145_c0_g1_i1.p1 TRINITY_DN12145_c0_g1~~TRINITY_DN12145_c0_g1_i1.p1  ORF type:complete len:222 (-),score=35.11 TRINITY_DN12145_c0_g1_i1:55-720(-)
MNKSLVLLGMLVVLSTAFNSGSGVRVSLDNSISSLWYKLEYEIQKDNKDFNDAFVKSVELTEQYFTEDSLFIVEEPGVYNEYRGHEEIQPLIQSVILGLKTYFHHTYTPFLCKINRNKWMYVFNMMSIGVFDPAITGSNEVRKVGKREISIWKRDRNGPEGFRMSFYKVDVGIKRLYGSFGQNNTYSQEAYDHIDFDNCRYNIEEHRNPSEKRNTNSQVFI